MQAIGSPIGEGSPRRLMQLQRRVPARGLEAMVQRGDQSISSVSFETEWVRMPRARVDVVVGPPRGQNPESTSSDSVSPPSEHTRRRIRPHIEAKKRVASAERVRMRRLASRWSTRRQERFKKFRPDDTLKVTQTRPIRHAQRRARSTLQSNTLHC